MASVPARQKFDPIGVVTKILAMVLAPLIPFAISCTAAFVLPQPTYGGSSTVAISAIVSFIAIPFAWFFMPLIVFGFLNGRLDSLPRLCAVALLFGFLPALFVSAFGKNGNEIGISALVIALSISFLTWWLGRMFERIHRAVTAKH